MKLPGKHEADPVSFAAWRALAESGQPVRTGVTFTYGNSLAEGAEWYDAQCFDDDNGRLFSIDLEAIK